MTRALLALLLLTGCAAPGAELVLYDYGDTLECPKDLLDRIDKKLEELCPKQSNPQLPQ